MPKSATQQLVVIPIPNRITMNFKYLIIQVLCYPVPIESCFFDLYKKKSVGTVRIIATEGLDSLHTDKTTPHAKPLYASSIYGKHERLYRLSSCVEIVQISVTG